MNLFCFHLCLFVLFSRCLFVLLVNLFVDDHFNLHKLNNQMKNKHRIYHRIDNRESRIASLLTVNNVTTSPTSPTKVTNQPYEIYEIYEISNALVYQQTHIDAGTQRSPSIQSNVQSHISFAVFVHVHIRCLYDVGHHIRFIFCSMPCTTLMKSILYCIPTNNNVRFVSQ
jgi:hypothetical protein